MTARRMREPMVDGPAPPQNLDAERSVLAAMLLDAEAVPRARALLASGAFYRVAHQRIFDAIVALYSRSEPADLITVSEELRKRNDLEAVGGRSEIAHILESATTSVNLEAHAHLVREAARDRALRHLGLDLQARPALETADEMLAWLRSRVDEIERLGAAQDAGRFAAGELDGVDFAAQVIEKPRSLLGDGVLTAGGFAILYGRPGLGKTWLALTLSRALVHGESWMGLSTAAGARVGFLELELGAFALQERLRTLGLGRDDRDRALRVVARPMLQGVVDLCQAGDVEALRRWVRVSRLDVLILDALSRAHTANENAADELGPVLAALDALRHATGCALVLVHHEPKARDGRDPENHLDALRGTSRLQSDPTLLMRVWQSRGLRCLVFAKVTEGPTPEPIYFRLDDDGRPEVVKSPDSIRDENREHVATVVITAPEPVSRAEIEKETGLGSTTVKRHLAALVESGQVVILGEGRLTRYAGPDHRTASDHHPARADVTTLFDEDFDRSASGSVPDHGNSPDHRTTSAPPTGEGAGGPVAGDLPVSRSGGPEKSETEDA